MPKVAQVTYFEDTAQWKQNTAAVVDIVAKEIKSSRLRHVVMATCTGYTAAQFAPLAKASPKVNFVGVAVAGTVTAGFEYDMPMRFDSDELDMKFEDLRLLSGSILLVEVRL